MLLKRCKSTSLHLLSLKHFSSKRIAAWRFHKKTALPLRESDFCKVFFPLATPRTWFAVSAFHRLSQRQRLTPATARDMEPGFLLWSTVSSCLSIALFLWSCLLNKKTRTCTRKIIGRNESSPPIGTKIKLPPRFQGGGICHLHL